VLIGLPLPDDAWRVRDDVKKDAIVFLTIGTLSSVDDGLADLVAVLTFFCHLLADYGSIVGVRGSSLSSK
jgi:hypothetical protein